MCDRTQTNNLQALFIIASVCLMSSQFTSSLNLRVTVETQVQVKQNSEHFFLGLAQYYFTSVSTPT